jgi:hypothetical protein
MFQVQSFSLVCPRRSPLSDYALPFFVGIAIALLSSLVVWGALLVRSHNPSDVSTETFDGFIIALLLLSALAMGVFVAYVLLGFRN